MSSFYSSLFFRLFNPNIPWVAVAASVAVALCRRVVDKKRAILLVWIVACVCQMLYSTVIGRAPKEGATLRLVPFWSIGAMKAGFVET